jgi:uncharacterized repeat protein (TIGR01451 family)
VFTLLALLVSYLPAASPAAAHTVNLPGANDTFNGTWPPNNSAGWNLPATNPALVQECGIDVGILIDRSGSIADAGEADNMRTSAKEIVESLAGTPSKVGVWSFGTGSSANGTSEYPAQQLTEVGGENGPAGVASLSATIDSIPIVTGVSTNYEAGFDSVDVASDANTDPDLLFVLTDGNPTVHIDDLATGGTTNNDDVDGGIRTANLVKANGTRIFGVGIGANISTAVLGLISNPVQYPQSPTPDFATAGYTLTSFANLATTLRNLVIELCGGSVTVEKLADPGTGVFSPAAGWSFTLDPANPDIPNQTKDTDVNGQANFDIDELFPETVTLTEDLAAQPGYVFLADQLECTNSTGDDPELIAAVNGVTFDLAPGDVISCTFKNKKEFVDLNIDKDDGGISTVPGGQVTYTLTYGNAGNVAAPNTVISETVPANTTVDLGVGPADGKNDGWVCNLLQAGVFPAGTTCTYAAGTVPAGASGLTVPFTVTVVNPAPFGLSLITNTATIDYDGTKGPDTNPADNTATDTTPVVTDPQLNIDKKVVRATQDCAAAVDQLTIVAGESVKYCYVVSNPGNAPVLNVVVRDDNATPGVPGDDFDVTLTGLTDQDGDLAADDLAAGALATGTSANKPFAAAGTFVNVATATGDGESDTDTATVVVTQPAVNIVKTAVVTGQACPGVDGANLGVVAGASVTYCYVVTNPGTAPLLNVVVRDDNGTPGVPGDDFDVTLTGLTNQDGDGSADDLAAAGTATGQSAPRVFNAVGSVTNVATVSGVSSTGGQFSDTDTATVVVTQPAVNIVKTAVVTGQACPGVDGVNLGVVAGASVTYCYVVTNPGTAPLLNVVVRDDNGTPGVPGDDFDVTLTGLTNQDGDGSADDLAAGATATGQSAPRVFNAVGSVTNVATVSGVSSTGGQFSDTDTATVVVTRPGLTIVKTAIAAGGTCPGVDAVTLVVDEGEQVRYCYVVTNPGNAPLLNVVVIDDNGTPLVPGDDFTVTLSGLTNQDGDGLADDLAAGATATGQSALKGFQPGTVINVATVTGASSTGEPFTDTDTAVVTTRDVAPTIEVTKDADPTSVPEPGGPVEFEVSIENTSAESVTVTSITDSVDGGLAFSVTAPATAPVTATTCATGTVIAPSGTYTCTFTLNVSGDAGDVVDDTVVATVVDNDQTEATDEDDASVTITDVPPTIDVTKTADPTSVAEPGGPVEFEVSIENTSFESVTVTSITDSVEGGAPFSVLAPATAPVTATTCQVGAVIAAGGTYTCTFTLNVSGDAGDVVEDTVVATVVDNDGTSVTDEDDASVTITDVAPTIDVTKTADPTSVAEPGGPVEFTVEVENTSFESVTVTSITDSVDGGPAFSVLAPATAPVTATTCQVGAVIAAGGTYTCTFTLNVSGDAGDVVDDTVVATVVDNDQTEATDEDDASVTITDVPPTIVVTKDDGGVSVPAPGGPVEFTVEVENTSFESVTVTSITDSVDGGTPFKVTAPAVAPVLATTCQVGVVIAAGGTYTCTFTVNVSGDAGDVVEDTVLATVVDNDGTPTDDTDDETTPVVAVPEVLGEVVTPPATPAVVSSSALPFTGSDATRLVLLGLALLGAGALLVAGVRRRRHLGE